jgi:hypothetical protein
MNNSKTPKIVVGVALAAIYATALAAFMPRGTDDIVAAENSSAVVPTQFAPEPAPLPDIVPPSADTLTSGAEQSAGATAAVVPVPSVTAKPADVSPSRRDSEARSQGEVRSQGREQSVVSVAPAAPANEREVEKPAPASQEDSADQDSETTADVKSQTADVAPDGNIDAPANSGDGEQTGSVSSQE